MNHWDWVVVRAYTPALVALMMAVLSMLVMSGLQASPLLASFASTWRWIPLFGLAATVWLIVVPTFRLWHWNRGGVGCPTCGGPLGHERAGYASRGGAYRRCYACGDNVNHRHYE